jgi:LmbE family N-acetylglucosaminyl deacetylase
MRLVRVLALLCVCAALQGAESYLSGTAAIKQALARAQTQASALMIAAHPDDENTAVLAYLARGRHVRTGYLSLTRGEGGQNRIGPEKGFELGVIRTQELLAARRIDGAQQFFTSAVDFGYSKTAEETFAKWGREKILGEIVRRIREFRPDVIILRFSGTPRDGHGQHQASAILGKEAFRAAADPRRFPEQLRDAQPWQAKRIVWNVFSFTPQMEREARQMPDKIEADAGEFDPVLGRSYAEIAGISRSMHKSQGFGSAERRGSQKHYFVHVDGDPAAKDLFDGVPARASAQAAALFAEAEAHFDPEHPDRIIPILLRLKSALPAKAAELDETIALCSGLWLDADAAQYLATPGGDVATRVTVLNRSPHGWNSARVRVPGAEAQIAGPFAYNRPVTREVRMRAVEGAEAEFEIDGLRLRRPVLHRYVDPVEGERTRDIVVAPAVSVNLPETALLFADAAPKRIQVEVRANVAGREGKVALRAPAEWKVEPAEAPFRLESAGDREQFWFRVTPPSAPARVRIEAVAVTGGQEIATGMRTIEYSHIAPQTLQLPAARELVRADVRVLAKKIGYVAGAGDEIPQALAQIGCEVAILSPADVQQRALSEFDAVVTGVRAYSVHPELAGAQRRLLDYAKDGGTLVVQYNERPPVQLGPYPMTIYPSGQGRVSVEEAPVEVLAPDHPLLNRPNRITARDFEGWVQERGLYFAKTWDPRYQTLIASHDPGEAPLAGGMLYAPYGKGVYIFTAYAWFRQLPAGVPGAYRMFANLLSAGKVR